MPQDIDIIGKHERRLGLKKLPRKVARGIVLQQKMRHQQRLRNGLVSAKAVILFDRKVLLLQDRHGRWDLPGGKLDPGERVLTGLHREVQEETGLKIRATGLLTTHLRQRPNDVALFVANFLCQPRKALAKSNIRLSQEHMDYRFASFKKACKLEIAERHLEAIETARFLLEQQSIKAA